MEYRRQYHQSPAYFLDCAEFFSTHGQPRMTLQVLSNIAELELENHTLLRMLGYKLARLGLLDLSRTAFEQVLQLRPEEPQSYRDLALVLAGVGDYRRSMERLYHVVMNQWPLFPEIAVLALMDLNRIIAKARQVGITDFPVEPRLIKLLDVDLRVVLTWDADMTDLDLWVVEPTGEKAIYCNNRTAIGGLLSRDITQGYGPDPSSKTLRDID